MQQVTHNVHILILCYRYLTHYILLRQNIYQDLSAALQWCAQWLDRSRARAADIGRSSVRTVFSSHLALQSPRRQVFLCIQHCNIQLRQN